MGTYRMVGNKAPGQSANETGSDLPPSLTSWSQDGALQANMDNFAKGLVLHAEEGKEKKEIRQKKRRFKKNAPKNALENQEFIKAGGGSRPAF